MSAIYHKLNNKIAPSFEALYQEFVVDPIGLDPDSREKRKNFLMSYFKSVYDQAIKGGSVNNAIKQAYEVTRKKAYQIYITRLRDKKPSPPDAQLQLWGTTEKKRMMPYGRP